MKAARSMCGWSWPSPSGDGERLLRSLEAGEPLTALDWCRAVLATEIVFASNLMGSGHDWMFTTGLSDERSIVLLRQIQRKLPSEVHSLIGTGFGTPWRPDSA